MFVLQPTSPKFATAIWVIFHDETTVRGQIQDKIYTQIVTFDDICQLKIYVDVSVIWYKLSCWNN